MFNKYWTCLAISASESGGKKEKVSNILREEENKTNEEWSVSKFRGFARGTPMFFKGSQLNKSTLHGSSPLG